MPLILALFCIPNSVTGTFFQSAAKASNVGVIIATLLYFYCHHCLAQATIISCLECFNCQFTVFPIVLKYLSIPFFFLMKSE